MSWTDEELDKLFREAAGNAPTPEYNESFFKDIESQLPVRKSNKSLLWWWSANIFIVSFLGWIGVEVFKGIIPVGNDSLREIHKQYYFTSKKEKSQLNIQTKNDRSTQKSDTEQMVGDMTSLNNSKLIEKSLNENNKGLINETFTSENYNKQVDIKNELTENVQVSNKAQTDQTEQTDQISMDESSSEMLMNTKPIELLNSLESDLINGKSFSDKIKTTQLYGEVTFGLQQSWIRPLENSSPVYGTLGLNGGVIMSNGGLRYSAGLGLEITKFDKLLINERSIIYGLGSNTLENTYAFNSILSLTMPLQIDLTRGRFGFNLGVVPSVNLLSNVYRSKKIDGNQIVSRSGYSDVTLFNSLGMKPNIGVSYFINEKTQIGVKAGIQLLQPVQSERFVSDAVKMPVDGQFYIRRSLTIKR